LFRGNGTERSSARVRVAPGVPASLKSKALGLDNIQLDSSRSANSETKGFVVVRSQMIYLGDKLLHKVKIILVLVPREELLMRHHKGRPVKNGTLGKHTDEANKQGFRGDKLKHGREMPDL
jgi:hypothetical protein